MSVSADLTDEIEAGSLKRRSVRGGAATIASQAVKFLIRFAGQIAIARLLVPADYGLVAMAAPLLGLLQLFGELGLGQAVLQRQSIQQEEVSGLFWIGLTLNIAIAIGIAVLAPFLAWIYREPRLVMVTVALAALIPISSLATLPQALLRRNLRFGALSLLDIFPAIAGLLAGVSAAWSGLNYWSLILAAACESLAGAILVWALSAWRPSFCAISKSTWKLVVTGGHLTLFNLAQYVTMTFDNILISVTLGPASLGLYDRGYKTVSQPLLQIMSPIDRIAVPVLVRLLSDSARYKRVFSNMLELLHLFLTPGLLFGIFAAEPLMHILLGPKWAGIAPIVSWFCLGALGSAVNFASYWLFLSQGRTRQQLRFGLVTSLVSVAGFAAGLPWGPAGVAAGASLSFFLVAAPISCWGATRSGPVTGIDLLIALRPIFGASIATAAALAGLSRFASANGAVLLIVAIVVAYGTFLLTLACLRTGRDILLRAWQLSATFKREKPTLVAES